jgi:hypothetical protein
VSSANTAHRKNERGITIVLVAFSSLAVLGTEARRLASGMNCVYPLLEIGQRFPLGQSADFGPGRRGRRTREGEPDFAGVVGC